MVGRKFVSNSGLEFTQYGLAEKHRPGKTVLVLDTADVPFETGRVLQDGRGQEMLDLTRQIEYSVVDSQSGSALSDGDFLSTDSVSKGFHRGALDLVDSLGRTPYLSFSVSYSDGTDPFSEKAVTFNGRVSDAYLDSPGEFSRIETSRVLFPLMLSCFEAELAEAGYSAKGSLKGYIGSYSFEGKAPTKAEMDGLVGRASSRALFNYLNGQVSSENRKVSYVPKATEPF